MSDVIQNAITDYLIKEGWCQWSDFEWRGQEGKYRLTGNLTRSRDTDVTLTISIIDPKSSTSHSNIMNVNFNESKTTACDVYSALDLMIAHTKKVMTFFQGL